MSGVTSIRLWDGTLDANGLPNMVEWESPGAGAGAKVCNTGAIPSSYTGDKTFTTSGDAIAIASGVNQITVTNDDATNFARFAFGESITEAITNAATGRKLYPRTAANAGLNTLSLGVPKNATHFAMVADTGSIVADVQQEK